MTPGTLPQAKKKHQRESLDSSNFTSRLGACSDRDILAVRRPLCPSRAVWPKNIFYLVIKFVLLVEQRAIVVKAGDEEIISRPVPSTEKKFWQDISDEDSSSRIFYPSAGSEKDRFIVRRPPSALFWCLLSAISLARRCLVLPSTSASSREKTALK